MRLFLVNTLHCISGQNRTDTIQEENTSSGLNHEVNIFFQHRIVVSLNYRCVSRICKNLGVLDRRGGLQSSSKSHFTLTGAFTCSALCSAAYFSGDSQWEQIAKIHQKFKKSSNWLIMFMPTTLWKILNLKQMKWPETEMMWICGNLCNKIREITSGELIFWRN